MMLVLLLLFITSMISSSVHAQIDDDYDDYVRQVLEEDVREDDPMYYNDDDDDDANANEELLRQQQQQQQQQEAEEEQQRFYEQEMLRQQQQQEEEERQRMMEEEAKRERLAAEREQAFEKELNRMNEEQRKQALRQKRKGKRIVQSVLNASKRNNHYAVLGIRNWNVKIPPRTIVVPFSKDKYRITLPGTTLLETTPKDIKRAYRSRALATHPDKNRNGMAQEAFIAVEHSASILMDPTARSEYDAERRLLRKQVREELKRKAMIVMDVIRRQVVQIITIFKKLLGPFAAPVLILGIILF